ncbi:hypothetical protein CN918_32070 [Priestia megaterium]|nr:hypothetical protein CN918_32070 [Priestia megaterium]
MTKKLIICVLLLVSLLAGCKAEGDMTKKEIETRAKNVAIDYVKVNEGVDFVVDDYEFLNTAATSVVVVQGHEKGNEKKKMGVHVDYSNDFTVDMIGEGKVKK